MYKLAVFDIDGTLIDSERTGVESLIVTVRQLLGKEISYEESYRSFGIPSSVVPALYGYEDASHFARVWEDNYIALSGLIVPFPGVFEMLADVKALGLRTGIVTSRSRMEFGMDPLIGRMLPFLDVCICSEDSEKHKPEPEPLIECIKRINEKYPGEFIGCSETLYLGDTMHDYLCAKGAGCDFALADWKGKGWQDIEAKYKFDNARTVLDILRGEVQPRQI